MPPKTRSGAAEQKTMEGFREMMNEMMAQQEAKIQIMLNARQEEVQTMLDAHKEEVEQNVKKMFEEQSSTRRTNEGGEDNSVRSKHGGEEELSDRPDEEEEEAKEVRCTYKDFKGCHPPIYDGTPNPLILLKWVIEMEMAFIACRCLDSQKTDFAISKLEDDALERWLVYKETANPEEIGHLSWEDFLENLKNWFCTKDEVQQLEKGFLNFKKGGLTISEYNSRFGNLMSFSRRVVPDESTKVARYIEGLPFDIRRSMANPATLQQAMKRAVSVSRLMEEHEKVKGKSFPHKGRIEGTSKGKGDFKKPKILPPSKVGEERFKPLSEVMCFKCGENGHYANKCPSGAKCFECNELGHLSYTCPNKKEYSEEGWPEGKRKSHSNDCGRGT